MSIPKKLISLINILLILMIFVGQIKAQLNFEKADSIAVNMIEPFDNVEELAIKLTDSLDTELDKARVFYMWIAKNVRYDCRKYHNRSPHQISARTKEEYQKKLAEWRDKQVKKTIKSKKGICEDYSRLYKALCDAVGLEAVVITGNARDFHKPYRHKHDNPHAWNAVKIDDKWQLLDATWGAGYTNPEVTKFSRKIAPGFFFTPPSWFIQSHYPDDEKWQLLEQPLSKNEFINEPLINYGQVKYRIKGFSPKVIQIEGKKNVKEIWFEFETTPNVLVIANKKGKKIDCLKTEKEGKVILSFSRSSTQSIIVYAGKSMRSRMDWIAMFEL